MSFKTQALTATLAGAMCLATAAQADREDWPDNFTVGTASQGGTYFVYGSGWANLIADELGVSGGGEVTGGNRTRWCIPVSWPSASPPWVRPPRPWPARARWHPA